jgi:probable rRNA maturation factor
MHPKAPSKMILIDPDLDPHPAPRKIVVSPLAGQPRTTLPWRERIPTKPTLARFLAEAQQAVRLRGEVNVLLTTDAAIKKLNRQFRGKNKPTDVLSFPAEGIGAEEIAGDLAISVETARRQAADQGHALTCELKVLILHGLLHLAGQDHETDNGKMARREQKLRSTLRLPQGLIERANGKIEHTTDKIEHSNKKAVILSDRTLSAAKGKGVEGPAFRDLAKAKKPGAPSIPRSHAEWVGNHKPRKPQTATRKASLTSGGRP